LSKQKPFFLNAAFQKKLPKKKLSNIKLLPINLTVMSISIFLNPFFFFKNFVSVFFPLKLKNFFFFLSSFFSLDPFSKSFLNSFLNLRLSLKSFLKPLFKSFLKTFLFFFILLLKNPGKAHNTGSTSLNSQCGGLFHSSSSSQKIIYQSFEDSHHFKLLQKSLTPEKLRSHAGKRLLAVLELKEIITLADRLNIQIWLINDSAADFAYYIKWDLLRQSLETKTFDHNSDFHFHHIFKSEKGLELFAQGSPEKILVLQNSIIKRMPHVTGNKKNLWTLNPLEDYPYPLFDTHQKGMIQLTQVSEPLITDVGSNLIHSHLKASDLKVSGSQVSHLRTSHLSQSDLGNSFLSDILDNQIRFFPLNKSLFQDRFSPSEKDSSGNKVLKEKFLHSHDNQLLTFLFVLRFLEKAFRYDLHISDLTFSQIQFILTQLPESFLMTHPDSPLIQEIHKAGLHLFFHSVNIEKTFKTLTALGLKQKLLTLGSTEDPESPAFWFHREPLTSKPLSRGYGQTALELGIEIVSHETHDFQAYKTIISHPALEPNILKSRQNQDKELAALGDGFYVRVGTLGAKGTGLTIRFYLHPNAREGTDFLKQGEYLAILNKKALTIIPESLDITITQLLYLAGSNQDFMIHPSNRALIENFKEKITAYDLNSKLNVLIQSGSERDYEKLLYVLDGFQIPSLTRLIHPDVMKDVTKNIYTQVKELISTHGSSNYKESSLLRYIKITGSLSKKLVELGLLHSEDFFIFLKSIFKGPYTFDTKKLALFEALLHMNIIDPHFFTLKEIFTPEEIQIISTELKLWHYSIQSRRKNFALYLDSQWSLAVKEGSLIKIQDWLHSGLITINHKNISGVSLLQLAAYYNHPSMISWIASKSSFKFHLHNRFGFNELEQLYFSGYTEALNLVISLRPDLDPLLSKIKPLTPLKERHPLVTELPSNLSQSYPHGPPIIDFISIETSSFVTYYSGVKTLIKVSKSFEVSSVDISQQVYRDVVFLIKKHLYSKDYHSLNPSPSYFKGDHLPVEQVSFYDTSLWLRGLNELSKLARKDSSLQESLSHFFPGHNYHHIYNHPTTNQWDLVLRLGGVAEGPFPHGSDLSLLPEYSVIKLNSEEKTWPVGYKKPVFYKGKPLYDLYGNVSKWMDDSNDSNLVKKQDPLGLHLSPFRVYKGAHWLSETTQLETLWNEQKAILPINRVKTIGLRLVRHWIEKQ
jgi:formylglycine-generating enzyme required for sulfatase activity